MPDFEGKPIRMRGLYRAVENEKNQFHSWAEKLWIKRDSLGGLLAIHFRNINMKPIVFAANPFLALSLKEECFPGKYLPVPLRYGDKE